MRCVAAEVEPVAAPTSRRITYTETAIPSRGIDPALRLNGVPTSLVIANTRSWQMGRKKPLTARAVGGALLW